MKKTILLFSLITATSFHFLSAQTTSPVPYCIADFDDAYFNVPDAIKSVSFGTLTNVTDAQYAEPHYVFYNNLAIPNFTKGNSYNLTVIFEVNGGCGYGVWIDFNHDNIFDASEKVSGTPVGTSLDILTSTTITENITIPVTSITGETRMRVRIVEDDDYTMGANGYSIQACNASTSSTDVMDWGETEDYTINIVSTVGVDEISTTNNFIIYPNPTTTILNLSQEISDNIAYKIINITGQEMQLGVINSSEHQINVSQLTEGIYFLQLSYDNTIVQRKFMKTDK